MTISEPWFTAVLIGDGSFCDRVGALLQARPSLVVSGTVGADDAVTAAVGWAPDVVVIADPPGEGRTTVELAAAIGAALPASRLLVVTEGGAAPTDPAGLIGAWVGGVVDLDVGPDLADAVESLALGEALLDRTMATVALERHAAGASAVALTPTEEEVLRRLAAGDPVDMLAAEHAVPTRLVRLHAGGALARLHPSA
jgi:DNA-binding NarL/FixJ family response regulator